MAEANPQVVIVAGPNGAGKSTSAPFLLRDAFGPLEYVNADVLALGLSAFRPEDVALEAGRVMLEHLRRLTRGRTSFAFESTLASRSHATWIGKICQEGYSFHLLFVWLQSPDLAMQRVKERVRAGGHGVPEDVVRRRYFRGVQNFFDLYRALATTWAVHDNSFGGPVLIASGRRLDDPDIVRPDLWYKFCRVPR